MLNQERKHRQSNKKKKKVKLKSITGTITESVK